MNNYHSKVRSTSVNGVEFYERILQLVLRSSTGSGNQPVALEQNVAS